MSCTVHCKMDCRAHGIVNCVGSRMLDCAVVSKLAAEPTALSTAKTTAQSTIQSLSNGWPRHGVWVTERTDLSNQASGPHLLKVFFIEHVGHVEHHFVHPLTRLDNLFAHEESKIP